MLDFPEEFFRAEIREGFFIDQTMKTVWAAQLEVLQVIAEVCDRHGITWFAGYGTLLGAVRHQGFIPWDDDMDIVMRRSDFMKLIKVFPQEMPEGFQIRSAFSEQPYPEYHACITNGSQISIAKEQLERFHGCPFTVGVDVFPLDYLPRNPEERVIVKNLFAMARQVVWLAKDAEKTEENIKELVECLNALEEYCNIKIDRTPVETEQWDDLVPPMWKLAHQLAMSYDGDGGEEVALYADIIKWPYKVFRSEWFDGVAALPYEQFAVPGPIGYDEFLKTVYGNYSIRVRKSGMHDYPFYKKQLEYLRDYYKDMMGQAKELGLPVEEGVTQEDTVPAQMEKLLRKTDGSRKKAVLFANDIRTFLQYGDIAIDKLESILQEYYEKREQRVLWWRPHPAMQENLDRFAPALGERYRGIVERYAEEGWGILDTTEDMDRAVKNCASYYGDLNQILQPFQETGRPFVIIGYEEPDKTYNPIV